MARLLNVCRLPRLLFAMALLLISQCAPLLGQSSPATKTPTLVVSAEYMPGTDTIQLKLVNHSRRAATAYNVALGLMNEQKQIDWKSGFGEDLLNPLLNAQCDNVLQNSLGGNAKHPPDSWDGAIKPEDTRVQSIAANLDKSQLNSVPPALHAAVTGIIWSDGSIETSEIVPWAAGSMNRVRDQRKEDAGNAAKVAAILNAHPEDTDIQHRIGEAVQALEALAAEYPRQQPSPEGKAGQRMFVSASPVVSEALNNLKILAASSYPKELFEAFSASFECKYKLRVALLQPDVALARDR
jgi:hypothetical protein